MATSVRNTNLGAVNDCHMPEPHRFNQRQRQRRDGPAQPSESLQPVPENKKVKVGHANAAHLPAAFWYNLSEIWLTKNALRELDRRNSQFTQSPPRPHHQNGLPFIGDFPVKSKRNHQSTQCTANYLRYCEPQIVKDLKLFARRGGPDLSDLRQCPEPIHSSDYTVSSSPPNSQSENQSSATTPNTTPTMKAPKTKTTGVYDRNFLQHLIDNDVYPDEYEYPDGSVPAEPNNWMDFSQILAQPRPSLSLSQFPDEEFRRFKRANAHAAKERQVSDSAVPFIEGNIGDLKCCSGGVPFTNLGPLTDGTLKPGNPDVYYGARPEQLSQNVRAELSDHIVPSTQHDLPIVPNFFLAAKGPNGTPAVATRQACYDGALGARGMHSLKSYGRDEPVYDNNAHTVTSIYQDGQLKIYTSHLTQPRSPGARPEYHMHQLNAWAMTGSLETFRQGATAYRNLRDWAKEQRNHAIRQANERANHAQATVPAVSASEEPHTIDPSREECQTSVNEHSNTRTISQEPETPPNDPTSDCGLPSKRSRGYTMRSHGDHRKRRKVIKSNGSRRNRASAVTFASEHSSKST